MALAIYMTADGNPRCDVWISPVRNAVGDADQYGVFVRNPLAPDEAPICIETTRHYWHAESLADHWNRVEF